MGLLDWLTGRGGRRREWDIRVEKRGRGGPIFYLEGERRIPFDFELGGTVGGFIYAPAAATWDAEYPWAIGRRSEILDRVAQEFIRREFRGYVYEFERGRDDIIVVRRDA